MEKFLQGLEMKKFYTNKKQIAYKEETGRCRKKTDCVPIPCKADAESAQAGAKDIFEKLRLIPAARPWRVLSRCR